MSDFQLNTAVALIIFNRPETTQRVFEVIRHAKPPKLFVIADGPRIDRHQDTEKCSLARTIIDHVDWPCEVIKNYSDINLGCKQRVSSGLNWVFDTVEEAIILEDDCLPHPSFFQFCEELLNFYRYDKRIMAISGNNFQLGRKRTEYSYYFSRYNHIWGWATWRRAWQHYDENMKLWPRIRDENWLYDCFKDKQTVRYWTKQMNLAYNENINTWGYRWTLACWIQNGLTILPNANLVSNIGFNSDATHTKVKSKFANMEVKPVNFPLEHPPFVICDTRADDWTSKNLFMPSLFSKAQGKLKRMLEF